MTSASYLNPTSNPILCNKLLLPQLVVNQYWIKFLLQYLLGHLLHYQQLLVLIMRLSYFNRARLNQLKLHIADSTHITGEHFFNYLKRDNWSHLYYTNFCQQMLDYFYSFIWYLLNLYMPIIRSSVTNLDKPWVNQKFAT